MILKKLSFLVAMAVAWCIAGVIALALYNFRDCFDEQCRTQLALGSRAVLAIGVVSYLAMAVFVIRRKRLD